MPMSAPDVFADAEGHGPRDLGADGAVLFDERRRDAQPPGFGPVAVDDRGFQKIVRAPRHVGQTMPEEAAAAGFGAGNGHRSVPEQRPDDLFETLAVAGVDPGSERLADHPLELVEERRGRRAGDLAGHGQSDREVSRAGQGRYRHAGRRGGVDLLEPRLHRRFSEPGQPDDPADRQPPPGPGQPGQDLALEHGQDLLGRAREKHDRVSLGLQPQPGRGAVRVVQDLGSFGDITLLEVRSGHGQAAAPEPFPDAGPDLFMEDELPPQDFSQRLARPIVLGGTESAHAEDKAGTAEGGPEDAGQVSLVISDDRFEGDFETYRIQAGGQAQRIGVLEIRRQELRADGDDLDLHGPPGLRRKAGPGVSGRPRRARRRRRRP